jgi:acetyl esterase/lipase
VPNIDRETFLVVVFFHTGRWTDGSKKQYEFVDMGLINTGYVVLPLNTRLYPDVKFPKFAEDAAKSVVWVYKNIASYKKPKFIYFWSFIRCALGSIDGG